MEGETSCYSILQGGVQANIMYNSYIYLYYCKCVKRVVLCVHSCTTTTQKVNNLGIWPFSYVPLLTAEERPPLLFLKKDSQGHVYSVRIYPYKDKEYLTSYIPPSYISQWAKKTREIKQINFMKFFSTKFHFLQFQKWPKINF